MHELIRLTRIEIGVTRNIGNPTLFNNNALQTISNRGKRYTIRIACSLERTQRSATHSHILFMKIAHTFCQREGKCQSLEI